MLKSMKIMSFIAVIAVLSACGKNEVSEQSEMKAPMQQMQMNDASATDPIESEGVISDINTDESMLTINHEAIPELEWPAMTMGFKVAEPTLLADLSTGQKIEFEFKEEDGNYILVAIKSKD